jgi:hypothetical protein
MTKVIKQREIDTGPLDSVLRKNAPKTPKPTEDFAGAKPIIDLAAPSARSW